MRQRDVGLVVCFGLLFSIAWGVVGCTGTAASGGCSSACGGQGGQNPSTPPPANNNNAALQGNYAFTFSGISGNGNISSISGAVGAFSADGAGDLTNGELDVNGVGAGGALTAQAFTGTYTIGADNRGVMTWNLPGGAAKFAIAMTANGNARFIKFDASGGSGTIGSGTIERADTNAFSTGSITGDYAFGAAGHPS